MIDEIARIEREWGLSGVGGREVSPETKWRLVPIVLSVLVLFVAVVGTWFGYKNYRAATSPNIVIVKNVPDRGGINGGPISYDVGFKNTGGAAQNWSMTAYAMSLPSGEYARLGDVLTG